MPPMPTTDTEQLWVNTSTGDLWTGKKSPGSDWRVVSSVPVTIGGKQIYIRNIFEDIIKLFPVTSYIYRKNPPLLIITDNTIEIKKLNINGIRVSALNYNALIYDKSY